ncbi:M28 family metallopeptidase [Mycolicibacterium komossense]|uniref:M20/M25/M40 family metallo-hydrolase n=1 Tax=Mycolicibacterium komossense TaxID=1779 RepID=A0ABT3CL68_9MYCO|nr:M28 family metallopeptidase [Mycolicibacterium komossense]MCV7230179.1 M20/M25/M40 family metallo-hydrolase [Mycolicibacterium komossense]
MRRTTLAKVGILTVVSILAACDKAAPTQSTASSTAVAPEAGRYADSLRQQVTTDAMMTHLQKLQDIANANNGTRAVGTPGFDASVDYVAGELRAKGFDVQTPQFDVKVFESDPGTVTLDGTAFVARALEYSLGTPADGVTAPLVPARVDDTPGCSPSDYDGLPVTGAAVLVDRGVCPFSQKLDAATQRGAVALIVADNVDEKVMGGTLGETTAVKIPTVSVTKADGAQLRAKPGTVTLRINANVRNIAARNVIAQTKTGSADNVVMAGAHLDSVPEGPGINDNGSGVAAVLETALQMGASPQVQNAVRFGFWGAEELGTVGSEKYIESLNEDQLRDIALYLNFDMLASPNPGYFTYDGDQSMAPRRGAPATRVPEGAAGIERTLVAYLKAAGKPAQDTSFDGRSDYDGFTKAGIPSGGLFAGAEEDMTADQAELWGGTAGKPFDPNYHQATDTIEHIDKTALGIQGSGVGYAVGLYAQDLGGRNGIPVREDRTRHIVTASQP